MKNLKEYPVYKDSGVEWLGNLPEQWKIVRAKRLFKIVNGSTPKSSEPEYWDGDIPWVTPDDLGTLNSIKITKTARTITESGYKSCGTTLVPANSLILSTCAPIGHLALTAIQMCTNQGCRFLVPRSNINPHFYYYQLLAGRQELKSYGQGSTFMELSKTKLGIVMFGLPPHVEQQVIANFLDRRTGQIDGLIAKKERVIELLREKRTALISHAVTKGLNPDAKMKDSQIDWLGNIPEHWEVMKLVTVQGILKFWATHPRSNTHLLNFQFKS